MSVQLQYSNLGKGARWHLKLDPHGRPYFAGGRQMIRVIWGLIGLVSLSAPLVMAFVLDGGEQIFYVIVSVCLSLFCLVFLGVRQHLVFDKEQGVLREVRSWWGLLAREHQRIPLGETQVIVAPIAALSEGCQLELLEHRYTIGSAAETRQLAALLRDGCGVQAMDRVAAWPETRPLADDSQQETEVSRQPSQAKQPEQPKQQKRPEASATASISADMRHPSLWDQAVLLKLAIPLPVLAVIGFVLAWVRS